MKYHSEVLLYIQKVKKFFELNDKAKEYYFVIYNETEFYEKVIEIAQKNFDKNGEPALNINQFELLRMPEEIKKFPIFIYNNIFIEMEGYEKICLN